MLDPDLFVIGGGGGGRRATFCWSRPATTTSVSWKAAPTAGHAKIVAATAGQDAGLIGAANLALR